VGHGKFDPRKQKASLVLQDEAGSVTMVAEDALAGMLERQGTHMRLIVLAACQSAARSTSDVFLGLAPRLVSIGVPAVLAMQDYVSIVSARKFSAAFYERLLEHGQVDLAANQARSRLLTTDRPDAAVPVLFMRLKSGRLWE
jgi:CHAT domain-containing protein